MEERKQILIKSYPHQSPLRRDCIRDRSVGRRQARQSATTKVMNKPKKIMMNDEDPYNIEGYSSSDDDRNESSDDELAVEGLKRQNQQAESDSEDDFEKEMDMELENVMRTYENSQGEQPTQKVTIHDSDEKVNVTSPNNNNTASSNTVEDKNDLYAEEYFSSGSDDEHLVGGQASKSKERRKVLTNDELFYDPDMDDEDEQWVIKQRQDHRKKAQQKMNTPNLTGSATNQDSENKKKAKKSKQNVEKVPSSDAILSCPACMTTLCIDCQRHELYKNQYRAMFVMNCKITEDEVLRYEPSQQHNSGKKRKKAQKGKLVQHTKEEDNSTSGESERYHPVTCVECNSEVAVYDSDEVYHFFNVLASYA